MKRIVTLAVLASSLVAMVSCGSPPPPRPVHVHHYHTPRVKSATTSYSRTPEGFQAVTPPASYSR